MFIAKGSDCTIIQGIANWVPKVQLWRKVMRCLRMRRYGIIRLLVKYNTIFSPHFRITLIHSLLQPTSPGTWNAYIQKSCQTTYWHCYCIYSRTMPRGSDAWHMDCNNTKTMPARYRYLRVFIAIMQELCQEGGGVGYSLSDVDLDYVHTCIFVFSSRNYPLNCHIQFRAIWME